MGERSLQAASNLPPLTSSVRLVAELARRSSSEPCSAVPPLRPNKDYIFDTISTEVIVLVFCQKALIFKAFYAFVSWISVRIKIIRFLSTEF